MVNAKAQIRTPDLRRTLIFLAGADRGAHERALAARPDVVCQDLEDFTPPALKDDARRIASSLIAAARSRGLIPAVRINLLTNGGLDDLAAILPASPALIMLPKAETARQIAELDAELSRYEAEHELTPGSIEIVPTAETAKGVVNIAAIAGASRRVTSVVLGAEDLAADLFATRTRDSEELDYARRRLLLECRAVGIEPIDSPYTFSDVDGAVREALRSRRLGYRAKSTVSADHVAALNEALTPSRAEIDSAECIITAFEAGRARGEDRVLVDGLWIEPPAYRNAWLIIERARQLSAIA